MNVFRPLISLVVVVAALTAPVHAQVVVASKIDTEGGLLGHMIALVLDDHGVETVDRIQLGGTPVLRSAILAGEVDIYPEYTGNAAFFFEKADDALWKDASKAYAEARKLDMDANHLVWLAPAPANNTWAIALRQDLAQANDIVTMSDFARYLSAGGETVLAASAEFINSAAALPAMELAYGFKMKPNQLLSLSGGDTGVTISAAANGIDGVNAAMVYGTDGAIAGAGLIVLQDDKQVQPVYEPAPVIRQEVLAEYPDIETWLQPVFAKLDLVTLQTLNGRVQLGGEPVKDVARDFLRDNGFLK